MRQRTTIPEADRVGVGKHPAAVPLHLHLPLPELEIRAGDCRPTVEDQPDGPNHEQQPRLCRESGTCDRVALSLGGCWVVVVRGDVLFRWVLVEEL